MKETPVKNRIRIILKEKGYEQISPTTSLLLELHSSRKHFFAVLDNRAAPTFGQCLFFSKWLKVTLYDLYDNEELDKVGI